MNDSEASLCTGDTGRCAPCSKSEPGSGLRYDLIAIDVDGTLLDPRGELRRANIEAIRDAADAGLGVVVCTGRGLTETLPVVQQLGLDGHVIVAGGALVAEIATGRTVSRTAMTSASIEQAVGVVHSAGHSALLLKDRDGIGYDFLVLSGEHDAPIDRATAWWFEQMRPTYRVARLLGDDEHPGHTVRVGTCVTQREMVLLEDRFRALNHESMLFHSFPTVAPPGDEGELMHVLEVFDARATKWDAVRSYARERGIETGRIAAIGDQVNDLSMLRGARLGIAMGNGAEPVKRVADVVAPSNDEDGVAFAIGKILSGAW